MTTLRVGTRGSDLALWQTRWVVDRLRAAHPGLRVEEVIIKTHGDVATDQAFGTKDWPVGGFVAALEQALASERVDFAVHSYKDLQTAITPGLVIAAVPSREVVHDVLVTATPVKWDHLPDGFRLGTSSPRRAAQFRRATGGRIAIVPIRGNVATRMNKVCGDMARPSEKRGSQAEGDGVPDDKIDGTVLAAAGLKRLGLDPPHRVELPTEVFLPSPAQGALALQAREGSQAAELLLALNDAEARGPVEAERSFLRTIGAGCHVPVGALAERTGIEITLRGQLFDDDGVRLAEAAQRGQDPVALGTSLADSLRKELQANQ